MGAGALSRGDLRERATPASIFREDSKRVRACYELAFRSLPRFLGCTIRELRLYGVLRSSRSLGDLRPAEDGDRESTCAWSVSLAGFPGAQPRQPSGHRASVGLVVGAEAAREGGFLVEPHEHRYGRPDDASVQH